MKRGGGNHLSHGLPVLCPAPAPCTPTASVSTPTTCRGNTQTPSRPSNQGRWSADPRLPPSKTRALPLCMRLLSHGRLQPARLLYPWGFPGKNTGVVAISFTRGSSRPRDQTQVSCIVRKVLHQGATTAQGSTEHSATKVSKVTGTAGPSNALQGASFLPQIASALQASTEPPPDHL